jgi:hypothetical protein
VVWSAMNVVAADRAAEEESFMVSCGGVEARNGFGGCDGVAVGSRSEKCGRLRDGLAVLLCVLGVII